jgi:uncharacterized coiled-coil protein SlyX
MSFTVRDFKDLLQLLSEHPEWREELRHTLLSDDFLALPKIIRELAEAQKINEQNLRELIEAGRRHEGRLVSIEERMLKLEAQEARVEERLLKLEERVIKVEERLLKLEERVAKVEERLLKLEERIVKIEERLAKVEEQLDKLSERVDRIEIRLAKVDGRTLEIEYERKAGGYFGRIIRDPQVVNLAAWEKQLSPPLTEEEFYDVWLADLILRGQIRKPLDGQGKSEAWLVIEVSVLMDVEDVERAVRRAALLRKANLLALPVVAGEEVTERALQMAEGRGVILVKDGSIRFVEQALQRYG